MPYLASASTFQPDEQPKQDLCLNQLRNSDETDKLSQDVTDRLPEHTTRFWSEPESDAVT